MLVYKEESKWVQSGLGLRQHGVQHDRHLKQDIRSYVEDLQVMQGVKDTRWNQDGKNDAKKTSETLLFSNHWKGLV